MSYDDYKWKKRKYFIRINCWIIIALLVAILCFMFPIISNADEPTSTPSPSATPTPSASFVPIPSGYTSFKDYFNVQPSDIFGSDVVTIPDGCIDPCQYDFSHQYLSGLFDNDLSNGEVIIDNDFLETELYFDPDGEYYSLFDFGSWVMTYMGNYDYFQVRLMDPTFTNYPISNSCIFTPDGMYNGALFSVTAGTLYISGYQFPSVVINSTKLSGYNSNVYVFDSSTFSDFAFPYCDMDYYGSPSSDPNLDYPFRLLGGRSAMFNTLIASNSPFLYTINPSERNGGLLWSYVDNNQGYNDFKSDIYGSPWYQIINSAVSPDSDTFPDGSGGTDDNNLYMRTADWKFNIPKYWPSVTSTAVQSAYTSKWGEGSITFSGLLNDYQKANSENFDLNFKFHIYCYGHHFSTVHPEVGGRFLASFDYTDQVSLDSFIANNYNASFSVQDLFDFARNTNPLNDEYSSFTSFLNSIKNYESIDGWNWYITCDAWLSAGDKKSGNLTEKYNFISQVSKETSNTITDNTNPYIPEDPDDPNYNPDNNNNNSDSDDDQYSKNGINITITNNNDPTFTNNNNFNPINNVIPDGDGGTDENGDNLLTWIVKKLFGYIDALIGGVFDASGLNDNNDGVTQNSVLTGDSLGTSNNGFLAFMNSTFTFIPQGMWNVLQYFFTVSIVILVIAFLIRIILDIL